MGTARELSEPRGPAHTFTPMDRGEAPRTRWRYRAYSEVPTDQDATRSC